MLQTPAGGNLVAAINSVAGETLTPKVDALSPSAACQGIETPLTITGRNLFGAIEVTLDNGVALLGVPVATNEQITGLIVPADVEPGSYNVRVHTAAGTNLVSAAELAVQGPPDATISGFDAPSALLAAPATAQSGTLSLSSVAGFARCDRVLVIDTSDEGVGRLRHSIGPWR